jgi:two-component system, sensor histidine kinase and response regulator
VRLKLSRNSRNLLLTSMWLALFGTGALILQSMEASRVLTAMKIGIEGLSAIGELISETAPYAALAVLAAVFWITMTAIAYVVRYSRLRQKAILRENALSRREERAQALLDQIADALLLVNAEGEIRDCNNVALKMFGYPEEEIVGSTIAQLLPNPVVAERMISRHAAFAAFDDSSNDQPVRLLVRQKGGSTFPVEVSVGRAENSGEIMYAAIIRDVSETARLEAELSSAQLDAEAASHLAQKIAALAAESSLICRQHIAASTGSRGDPEHGLDPLGGASTLLRAVRTLRIGLDEIVSAAGPEAERADKIGVRYSPERLVEDIVQTIEIDDEKRFPEIFTFLGPDVPSDLYGDPGPLRAVLSRLSEFAEMNSIPGALGLEIRVKERNGDQVVLILSLSGSALGITEADLPLAQDIVSGFSGANADGGNAWAVPLMELNAVVEEIGGELALKSTGIGLSKLTATGCFQVANNQRAVADRAHLVLEGREALIVNQGGAGAEFLSMQLTAAGMSACRADGDKDAAAAVMAAKTKGTPYDLIVLNRGLGPQAHGDQELNRVLTRYDMASRVMVLGVGRPDEYAEREFGGCPTRFAKPIHQSAIIPGAARLLERVMAPEEQSRTGLSPDGRAGRAKIADKSVSDFA